MLPAGDQDELEPRPGHQQAAGVYIIVSMMHGHTNIRHLH